jgi:hypothetical protein
MPRDRITLYLALIVSALVATTGAASEPCSDRNPLRNVYWGELHVHTALSSDAWRSRVATTPDEAYGFARGETISIPPLNADGEPTQAITIDRPLDFAAVTDHAESMGLAALCTARDGDHYETQACDFFRRLPPTPAFKRPPGVPSRVEISKMLCGDDGQLCIDAMRGPWEEIRAAATKWNDETSECAFTTFNAFEWSGANGGPLLHRNVIFRNDTVTFPASSEWYPRPRDLRRHLEEECLNADSECDVLVIPHNSNTSQGTMWDNQYEQGEPEKDQAERIAALEPLIEIMQHKGDSECRNGFRRVLGSADEHCDFEKLFPARLPECTGNDPTATNRIHCTAASGYARYGLAIGLAEEQRLGVNPYRYGFVAATDAHNGNSGQVAEGEWRGHVGVRDATFETRTGGAGAVRNTRNNPGGLAAVWARENSREALFEAMRRRETYGTSGPRLTVRLFAGWNYPPNLCDSKDFVERGYAGGVPMGGTLGTAPSPGAAPRFAVRALKDPGTARAPGGQLQRIQIIKVWPGQGDQIEQRVYDIAGRTGDEASVDLATCTPEGPGADALCTVWSDPDFNPTQDAAYYARVLENPSCRWTFETCSSLPEADRPALCDDPEEVRTVQERAWTSPVWVQAQRIGPPE